jgi:hypothetical protein
MVRFTCIKIVQIREYLYEKKQRAMVKYMWNILVQLKFLVSQVLFADELVPASAHQYAV